MPLLPAKSATDLIELVRGEVLRRTPTDYAAYVWFTVIRCPDGSGDWLVQPRFDVPDPHVRALEEAARLVRKRFRLDSVTLGVGGIDA